MKWILSCFIFILGLQLNSQYLFPEDGYLFSDETLPRVDIIIAPLVLQEILSPQNLESNEEYPATFVWTKNGTKDTLENIGFRLRGNTSRFSAKKSFKIDFTTFGGERFHSLKEMNLNGEHNDPSIIRAKLCFDLYQKAGIPSSRTNMVNLYINNEYRGIYINVEHIDDRYIKARYSDPSGNLYKCYYGSDFTYISENPEAYKLSLYGNRVYELKTNKLQDNYADLAAFISVLNNPQVDDWKCKLESVLNVDLLIRAMVMDVLTGNWDGPLFNKNNSYWYYNPETSLFEYIPFDLDNTFGIDWFNTSWATRDIYQWSAAELRPLYDYILAEDEYRDRYSYYMKAFVIDFFNSQWLLDYTKKHLDLISDDRKNDTYARADYGYDYDDFLRSYDFAIGAHVKEGLKPYLVSRRNSLLSQLEEYQEYPVYKRHNINWDNETILFEIDVVADITQEVTVHYMINGSDGQVIAANDNGVNGDKLANDGIFSASLVYDQPGIINYQFEISNSVYSLNFPRCERFESNFGYSATPPIFINEFMSSNDSFEDENGDSDDWIEIYNAGSEQVSMLGKFLSDDHGNSDKWSFPDIQIDPGEFLLLWADEDSEQGITHTNFKLNKDGEQIGLWDSEINNFAPIDTLSYSKMETDVSWGRYPNGSGPIVILASPTPGESNVASSTENIKFAETVVFPNPVQDFFYIKSPTIFEKVTLFDANGKKLKEQKANINKVSFEMANYPTGIYFVVIEFDKVQLIKKIVKL